MTCPDDDALIALVEHALEPVAMAAIEAHADDCTRCRATIGHLAAIDETDGPRRVGRYKLERLLGQGGMGVVWQAWDPMLERGVAIKLLGADGSEHGPARLLREARALARLQHPNVVAVHDVGEFDGEVFIATELIDGEPMHRWQHDQDAGAIVAAYAQAARGLAAAHALGLVHRDVKPSNILVARDGRVRVGDFGLVTAHGAHDALARGDAPTEDALTAAGDVVGTPAYMAPEQRAGKDVTARSDQYSLCLALAEALLDARPPSDTSAAAMAAATTRRAPWAAIARGLARDPAQRWPDVTALAAALEAGADPPARARRPWVVAGSLAVIAAAVAAVAGWGVLGGSSHAAHGAGSVSARELGLARTALRTAAEHHDATACAAAAARVDALGDPAADATATERAECEMMTGQCARGTARIADLFARAGAPDGSAIYVRAWCPIEGDLSTRLDRAWTQAAAHEQLAYCAAIAAPVRAVAADVGAQTRGMYDVDSNLMRQRAADALHNLGRCYALAHRCDDAAAFWRDDTALRGIDLGHAPCR